MAHYKLPDVVINLGKPRRRLWFKFVDHLGKEWKAWLVIGNIRHDGTDCDGLTVFSSRSVYLSTRQDWNELVSTFFHEIVHVACRARYEKSNVDKLCANSELVQSAAEEWAARTAELGLSKIMGSLGFQLRPLPDGVKLRPRKK